MLERKVEREQLMAALSALDEALLRLANEHGRLTVASAVTLTKANRNPVKLHLRQLTEGGRLRDRTDARQELDGSPHAASARSNVTCPGEP